MPEFKPVFWVSGLARLWYISYYISIVATYFFTILCVWCTVIMNIIVISEYRQGEVCTQMEGGMSVVCGQDGSNCRLTNLHCLDNKYKLGESD